MKEVNWYRSFKKGTDGSKGVLDDYSIDDIHKMKIIANENQYGTYYYAALDNHVDLFHYVRATNPHTRIYNERIDEFQCQKPRFDIDIDTEKPLLPAFNNREDLGEYVKDRLIDGIIKVLKESNIEIDISKNILVFTSHGPEKVSYHIIVDKFIHANCYDSQGFYDKVVIDEIKPYVDRSISDRNHLLRMLWCHKRLNKRTKIFNETFTYNNQIITHQYDQEFKTPDHKELHIFAASLITYTSGCVLLPAYAKPKPTAEVSNINERIFNDLMMLMDAVMGEDHPYVVFSVNEEGIVRLRRTEKHMCPLCERLHDPNTMPYIYVLNNRYAYWKCGIDKSKRLYLGEISQDLSYMIESIRLMEMDTLHYASLEDGSSGSLRSQIRKLSDEVDKEESSGNKSRDIKINSSIVPSILPPSKTTNTNTNTKEVTKPKFIPQERYKSSRIKNSKGKISKEDEYKPPKCKSFVAQSRALSKKNPSRKAMLGYTPR